MVCRNDHDCRSVLSQKKMFFQSFFLCAYYRGSHRTCKKSYSKFHIIHRKTRVLETPAHVFSCEYCKIFKNTYFEEHLRTTASVTKALIVSLLSFVLIQTYKTFSLFNFHNFTCKLDIQN